jgi:integrase
VKHLSELYSVPVKKVTRSMIQERINANSDHPRVCEIMLLTLKQIFSSAQNDGLLGKNPCTGIELPRHIKNEKRALTDEEKQKLRSAVLQPQERLLLLLLYGTGCRPAEAYALAKSDFDFRNGTININKSVQFDNNSVYSVAAPKTNASIRSVIVSEPILKGLKHLVDKIPTDNVLGGSTGQIMNKTKYQTMFRHILEKAGLKDSGISQYTFRHNFVTECYYNDVSLKECQRQMGHKDYKMILEVYSHLDAKKENTREKMANMVM